MAPWREQRRWSDRAGRRRGVVLRLTAVVALIGWSGSATVLPAGPTSAQTTSSTTTATTAAPSSAPDASVDGATTTGSTTTPSTTAAADPGPSTTATPAPTDPDPTGPDSTGPGDEADQDPADPLADEGQSEEAPGIDVTVPPPDTYSGQEPYRPPEILWSSVAEAERKLEAARDRRRDAVAEVRVLRLRLKHLGLDQEALDERTRTTLDELDAATARYRGRAVTDYRLFAAKIGSGGPAAFTPGDLDQVVQTQRGAQLAAAALDVGEDDLDDLGRLRERLGSEARQLVDSLRLVTDLMVDAEGEVAEAAEDIEQAEIEYEAFRAGSEVFIDGIMFPIGGPHEEPLIDSFGFPRMTGTPDEHWHEGIDIFAPRGTPLVATERGLVTRIGNGRLGGLKLWLVGASGTEWYYAHLDSFAEGLVDGQVVEAGDLLGYVGNTGNAISTPPHLHMQMHPGGGRPVNPYPLLAVVSRLDRQAIAAGVRPAWLHPPVVVDRTPVAAGEATP